MKYYYFTDVINVVSISNKVYVKLRTHRFLIYNEWILESFNYSTLLTISILQKELIHKGINRINNHKTKTYLV